MRRFGIASSLDAAPHRVERIALCLRVFAPTARRPILTRHQLLALLVIRHVTRALGASTVSAAHPVDALPRAPINERKLNTDAAQEEQQLGTRGPYKGPIIGSV